MSSNSFNQIKIITTSSKLDSSDREIQIGLLTGSIILKLPPASSCVGKLISISDIKGTVSSSNKVTLSPFNNEKINNNVSFDLATPYGSALLFGTSRGWWVLNSSIGTGGGSPSGFTTGSLLFYDGGSIAQNNSKLFWDKVNLSLGIGTIRSGSISSSNPFIRFKSTGSTSSTSSFEITNSLNSSLFFVRDDGYVSFSSEKIKLDPGVSNSLSSIAYVFDTVNTLTTTGSKIFSFKNGGIEFLSLGKRITYSSACDFEFYLPSSWNVIKSQGRLDLESSTGSININPFLVLNSISDPPSPSSGSLWWNGTNLNFKTGSSIIDLLAGGGSITHEDVRDALVSGGDLPVRYDVTQPEIDCLWVSPTGQIVLITGSP